MSMSSCNLLWHFIVVERVRKSFTYVDEWILAALQVSGVITCMMSSKIRQVPRQTWTLNSIKAELTWASLSSEKNTHITDQIDQEGGIRVLQTTKLVENSRLGTGQK